jgi:hypothetical protein
LRFILLISLKKVLISSLNETCFSWILLETMRSILEVMNSGQSRVPSKRLGSLARVARMFELPVASGMGVSALTCTLVFSRGSRCAVAEELEGGGGGLAPGGGGLALGGGGLVLGRGGRWLTCEEYSLLELGDCCWMFSSQVSWFET